MYKFIKTDSKFDINTNFWNLNFQTKFIEPYKQLYDRDTSVDKSISSKEMWCIWLYVDPSYVNKIGKLQEQAKKDAILAYYPEFDFNDELIVKCTLDYPEQCLTPAARAFRVEEASLTKRAKFIDEAEYTFPEVLKDKNGAIIYVQGRPAQTPGTAKDIDSMRKITLDIYKKYDIVRKQFEEEQSAEGRVYGGGQRTLMDEGGLQLIKDD